MTDDNPVSRRDVLKRGAVTAGVIGLGGVAATPASAATPVSGGGDALQNAIDAASDGDTVVVTDSATYDPIVVDVSVAIETDATPTIDGAGSTTPVVVDSDGVTLDGFTVTNPGGLLGVKVERDYDDATIVNNTIEDIGPTGRLGVSGVVVGQGDHDGIEIRNNTVRNLDQETTGDSGFPTVNGILFDADNSDPGRITNTVVNNNTIQNIESDIAPLGIVVQHETDGVDVNNNEIRDLVAAHDTDSDPSDDGDFGFTFAQGINVASPATADTTVARNVIEDITSEEVIRPEAVKIDGDGSGVTFRANQFLVTIGLNNQNGADDAPAVDARNNWWGSSDGPEEAPKNTAADYDGQVYVVGNVTYEPFLRQPPGGGGRGGGNGGSQGRGRGR